MFAWALENTVVASLLAVLVLGLERLLRSRPGLCHLLWMLVAVVLVTPRLPLPELPGHGLRRAIQAWLEPPEAREVAPRAESAPAVGAPTVDPLVVGLLLEDPHRAGEPSATTSQVPTASTAAARPGRATSLPLAAWLDLAWFLGAAAVLARSGLRIARFQRLVRASPPAPARVQREVHRVARRLGVPSPPTRLLAGAGSPSVWCLGKPLLLWPADDIAAGRADAPTGRNEAPSPNRSTLIAHELAHLARRDHWVSWLEVPAAALLWWNPLFWWIRGRIRYFAELACDAWAVWAYPADRRVFAEALIDMQARTARATVAIQGLGATDSELKDFERRLHMIMKKRVSPGVSRSVATLAVLGIVLVSPDLSEGGQEARPVALEASHSGSSASRVLEVRAESKRWHEKAEKLFQAKEHAQALEAFAQVVALDPRNGAAHGRLGYLLVGDGDLEAAERHFQRQYELGANRSTALYNIACARALGGDAKGAVKHVAAAVRHGFSNTELMATDSDLASIREEPAYIEEVERAKLAEKVQHELSRLAGQDDPETYFGAHAQLAEIRSANGPLQEEHGHMALKAGDYEGAAKAFGRQAETGHDVSTAHYNRACALSLAGDVDGAIECLQRAAAAGMSYAGILEDSDLDPVRGHTRFTSLQESIASPALEGQSLKRAVQAGDLAEALPALKEIATSEGRSTETRVWAAQALGRLLLENERYEEALATFEHTATLGADVDHAAFRMAQALAGLGEDERALHHVELALDLGYADAEAVGYLLEKRGLGSPETRAALLERVAAAAAEYGEKDGHGQAKASDSYGKKKAYGKGIARDV